ncbi:unnamed protein product [Phaedon cochleariae]|uniref:Peptidase M13 N-terminal domain-containing protein n=1 Tax=Phaedon cochleariae TaxID=80249 RepID=A0A9N9X1X1_PHACE|nr:unnamed protein product [Phaedon cochleariae]
MFEGIITIKGKLKVTGGGTGTLTHNAGAYLSDSCTYELCNKELDTVRYPGITSTVRGYLCYTPEDSRHLAIAGWNYPNAPILNTDGTFSMNIPLKHLFSIFNDHQVATWGKQSIRLVRARNDANSVKVVERANTALPGSPQTQSIAKITIESINLKVPHLTPNDDIKLQLLTRIKADESMMIPFRRWELHELPALTQGSTIEIWSVKTCSALDSPRYVIVFFQTKKADNLHEDVTLFDNANIKSIRLALNSDYYPQERMLLDFSRDQYADAHFNYTEFNKSYHNCQEKRSLVNFAEFKSRPMFVIDCSRRHLVKIEVCTSVPCVRTATDLLKLIDTKVDPCEDFYRFACGSFLQHTDLDNRGFISVQNFIEDEIHSEIRNILEQPIRQESPKSLDTAKKFYRACMNESAIDAAGLKKIKEILERIGGWPTLLENNWQEDDFDWLAVVHKLREMGVNFGVFYLVSVYRDEIDESRYVLGDFEIVQN